MEDTLRVRNRAIMLRRKTRIRPVDDARTCILSLRDKPGFVERFIDGNKGAKAADFCSRDQEHSSHEDSKDSALTQVFTTNGFALVNYSESEETDEDYIKDSPPTPHCDFVQKKMRNSNIQVVGVASFSDLLIDSSESIIDETDLQSDNEVAPKNILVNRVPGFCVPLNESSDDRTDEPSTSMSGMASQRPRRYCHRPMTLFQKHMSLKLRTVCHPCKNLLPQCIPNTRESRQKREVKKLLSEEAGHQMTVLQ